MTVNLSMLAGAGAQFFDNNGDPLSGGKVFTYAAGTTTPQATYTTIAGNVAHANPIVLDSAGRVPSGGEIWLTDSISYKFVLSNSTGTTIATYDNITGNGSLVLPLLANSNGSSLVGFIQNGSGAVATTVQTKLRETVSVKDFGAVGDGMTDDWAAIQSALDSGARKIFFPAGTYYCTKALLLYKKYLLEGEGGFQSGSSPSVLKFADTTCGIVVHRYNTSCDAYGYNQTTTGVTSEGADGTVIRHLAIARGNGSDTTVDGVTHGIRLRARAHIDSCVVSGFAGNGIHIHASSGGAATVEGNANNWGVSNTRVQNCQDGIFVDGADVNVGLGLHIDSSSNQRYGIYDSSFLGCTWVGCHCNGNTTLDVYQDSNNARSVFIGQYVETGGPGSQVTAPAVVIGGLWGGGVTGGYTLVDGAASLNSLTVGVTEISGATSGTGRYATTWNKGSISASRRVAVNYQVGLNSNYMPVGSVYGRGGASNSYTAGVMGVEVYDGSATTTVSITGVTQANPGVITTGTAHGFAVGDRVVILSVGGMTQLAGTYLVNTVVSTTQFTVKLLDNTVVDTTAYSAYTSGGTVGKANGYVTAFEAIGSSKALTPGSDNAWSMGSASLRWSVVYAATGTINTSDVREKQQVKDLSEAERAVAKRLKGLIKTYRWNDSVEKKGDKARIHVGVIAQDVMAAFKAEGLDAGNYGILCFDSWPDEFDEDGNKTREAGNRYGVRYDQLFAFVIAVL